MPLWSLSQKGIGQHPHAIDYLLKGSNPGGIAQFYSMFRVKVGHVPFKTYPLTRNYYENNSLRIIFRNFLRDFELLKFPGKTDFFKELRVKFVIFVKINISE